MVGQRPAELRMSLRPVLDSLLRAVPDVLLGPKGRADLLLAAERVPHALSRRNVGLELRLHGPAEGDLFLAARPTAPDGVILHDWLLDFPGGPTGTRLRLALSDWRHGVGWLARSCRFMLLEVDASRRVGDCLPPPAVFLIPLFAGDADADIDSRRNAFHREPEELVSALAQLAGARPDPAVAAELRRMLGLLPNRAELFAAGVMLSRPTFSAPRIAVRGLRASELAGLLSGLGRDRAGALLAPLGRTLAPHVTDLCVALDLGPQASDAVGLELYTDDRFGWNRLLDALVALGLADRDRVRAVAELASATVNGQSARINHVKLTAKQGGLAPAKLYAVMHPPADVPRV